MATIKSFTDISQSKKLAEILSLESADMIWDLTIPDLPTIRAIPYEDSDYSNKYLNIIPCWSLAALLDVFPPYLFEFERGIDLNVYPNLNGKGWHCSYMPNCIENMKTDKFRLITSENTLVDACYEMILKLHELKML